ncbi:MAG TPA: ankyrin repeat domain-containing protein [Vicinamibacterales bacterium]|nr:ankyrin repeat domain-containing protein [Vicinamibacterales bacterium]
MARRLARIVFGMLLIMLALGGVALVLAQARHSEPWPPASRAAAAGDVAALESHIDAGVSPDAAEGRGGTRLLASAARTGRLDAMRLLLDRGADPNLSDSGGNHWIPLMHAVHKHQFDAVRLLLERGARPDGSKDLRVTPLMMAVGSGQVEVATTLLDKGADPMRRTPGHGSMLTLAVAGGALTDLDGPLLGGCYPAMVKLLMDRAPLIRFDDGLQEATARLFARLNGCRESLTLIRGRLSPAKP